MRSRPHARGFSLLIVMMAVLVMSISGAAAVSIGGADNTAAASRSARTQARFAAESGLVGFFDANPIEVLGTDERTDAANANYTPTVIRAPVEIDSTVIDGTTYRLEHSWWSAGTDPASTGEIGETGAAVIVEGRMLYQRGGDPERVMARVWIGSVTQRCGGTVRADTHENRTDINGTPVCPFEPRGNGL